MKIIRFIRSLIEKYIPKYARLPLLVVLIFNFFVYYSPKFLVPEERLHYLSTAFDDSLPLVPVFIFIYVLAFLQWGFGYIIIARDSRERCYRILTGELIAKTIAWIIFLAYPTAIDHPFPAVTGPATWLLVFIYKSDIPTINLFPSLHCLESWLCFRGAVGLKKMPKWYTWFQLVFTLLVFAATILVKQHVWPDILGGIAIAELGQLLRRIFHAERVFEQLEKKPKEQQ